MKTQTLETPDSLGQAPAMQEFELPAYDWNKQSRNSPMCYITSNTTQTFDYKGNPCDAQSDED